MSTNQPILHFGCKLQKRKFSFTITREEYALENTKSSFSFRQPVLEANSAYINESSTEYTPEWCSAYRKLCLKNFDLQMEDFASLDQSEFEHTFRNLLNRYPSLLEITDLNLYKGVPGVYVMVLDQYKQIYIGQSNDICTRIKKHWSTVLSFDRTLLPLYAVESSIISIDAFRALDTTRIYVWPMDPSDAAYFESEMVDCFPRKFSRNRIAGGNPDPISALGSINTRIK